VAVDFGPISVDEARELLAALEAEIRRLPPDHLYLRGKTQDGLPLSFDAEWYPFIGVTAGYNPPERRRTIRDGVAILERLRLYLSRAFPKERPGGRFFLSHTGVTRVSEDGVRTVVVRWTLPRM
jgi:hypothetical protein